ncbi:MAG: hypothetical protein COA79_08175 [Planctomycetota bacterium]|nr:MAG: hypothetical protein COA79_08175 [Planctomycetota bacterium]
MNKNSFTITVICFLFSLCTTSSLLAQEKLKQQITLEKRWWNQHHFGWRLARSLGKPFAIVDGISGRARVGGTNVGAQDLTDSFEKQTGIKSELINGVLLLHRPNQSKRLLLEKELLKEGLVGQEAAWNLGWLKDARAIPALAKTIAGKDISKALAAAQALKRLEGEEDFNLQRWILAFTIEPKKKLKNDLFQRPLTACFPKCLSIDEINGLSISSWIPLREAAARLCPTLGESGLELAKTLSKDPSFWVRQAAQRSLRAWKKPTKGFEVYAPKLSMPDMALNFNLFMKVGDRVAERGSGELLAAFGSDEDLKKFIDLAFNHKNIHLKLRAWAAITANSGGPLALEAFKTYSNTQIRGFRNMAAGSYGLCMLLDGETLTKALTPRLKKPVWSLSAELLLARYGGPSAINPLKGNIHWKWFSYDYPKIERGYVAAVAIGYVGGLKSIDILSPLLKLDDLSTAISAVRGLGETGLGKAVQPLVEGLKNTNRIIRNRSVLALGKIGGDDSIKAIKNLLKVEKEYLVLKAAVETLKELKADDGTFIGNLQLALNKNNAVYNPVNSLFKSNLEEKKWIKLGNAITVSSIGETRAAMDYFSGVWLRYGGCTPYYNNECVGFDVASGKSFIVRPPENLGLFYNESRAYQGCSRSMAFDAKSRNFWINHAVGGSGLPANGYIMPRKKACEYDFVMDRFKGFYEVSIERRGGEGPTWYVADHRRGQIYCEWMGPKTDVLNTHDGHLVKLPFSGAPKLSRNYNHDPVAYDPVTGYILRTVNKNKYKDQSLFGLWIFDPSKKKAWKSKAGLLPGVTPPGNTFVYDSLNKRMVLFLANGVWIYEREKDAWKQVSDLKLKRPPYAVNFDPQHNVFIGLFGRKLSAFRLKNVALKTKSFYGLKE